MAPSPIPAPLPPWARTLIQLAPLISIGLQDVLEYIHEGKSVADPAPDHWMHIQAVFEHTTNVEPKDRYVTTFDIVNITNGSVDSTWTPADLDKVALELGGLCTSMVGLAPSSMRFNELRFYDRMFNPVNDSRPYPPSGPPIRIDTYNAVGAGTGGALPPQVCMTTTDKSPYPRHWGRNYWPAPSASSMTSLGNFGTTVVDAVATSVEQRYLALQNAEFFPVIPVLQIQGQPARGLLQINSVQVDDIADVQRRRRSSSTNYRAVRP